jgi:hypothetical protein
LWGVVPARSRSGTPRRWEMMKWAMSTSRAYLQRWGGDRAFLWCIRGGFGIPFLHSSHVFDLSKTVGRQTPARGGIVPRPTAAKVDFFQYSLKVSAGSVIAVPIPRCWCCKDPRHDKIDRLVDPGSCPSSSTMRESTTRSGWHTTIYYVRRLSFQSVGCPPRPVPYSPLFCLMIAPTVHLLPQMLCSRRAAARLSREEQGRMGWDIPLTFATGSLQNVHSLPRSNSRCCVRATYVGGSFRGNS